jgi:hypothetical protein
MDQHEATAALNQFQVFEQSDALPPLQTELAATRQPAEHAGRVGTPSARRAVRSVIRSLDRPFRRRLTKRLSGHSEPPHHLFVDLDP